MRIFLRKLVSRVADERMRAMLKRMEFKARKRLAHSGRPMNKADFARLFRDQLRLTKGDIVMVHASATMLHTELSNEEILAELRGAIGPAGTIVVPTFPAQSSIIYWDE